MVKTCYGKTKGKTQISTNVARNVFFVFVNLIVCHIYKFLMLTLWFPDLQFFVINAILYTFILTRKQICIVQCVCFDSPGSVFTRLMGKSLNSAPCDLQ